MCMCVSGVETCADILVCLKMDGIDCCERSNMRSKVRK